MDHDNYRRRNNPLIFLRGALADRFSTRYHASKKSTYDDLASFGSLQFELTAEGLWVTKTASFYFTEDQFKRSSFGVSFSTRDLGHFAMDTYDLNEDGELVTHKKFVETPFSIRNTQDTDKSGAYTSERVHLVRRLWESCPDIVFEAGTPAERRALKRFMPAAFPLNPTMWEDRAPVPAQK
jgi:hypothetical protein